MGARLGFANRSEVISNCILLMNIVEITVSIDWLVGVVTPMGKLMIYLRFIGINEIYL